MSVALALEPLLNLKFHTVRQRLRLLYREAAAKSDPQRAELDLTTCWAPWFAWVIEEWPSQTTCFGPGCDQFERSVYRVGGQRALPRLRGSGGLEGSPGQPKASLEVLLDNALRPAYNRLHLF